MEQTEPQQEPTARRGLRRRWRERSPRVRRTLAAVAVLAVALVSVVAGLRLAEPVTTPVGPVDTRMSLQPNVAGDTVVGIPPLGSLRLDSHDGPFRLQVQVAGLDLEDTRRILNNPSSVEDFEAGVVDEVRDGVVRAALRALLVILALALALGVVIFRRPLGTVACGVTALVLVAAGGGAAAFTWRPDSIAEPRFEGLLTSAPKLVGDASQIVDNFGLYRTQLAKIVTNVSSLYAVGTTLPTFNAADDSVRVLHVSDIHLNPAAWNVIRSVSAQFEVHAVVDTGDLTDHGSPIEARFAGDIATLGRPYLFVRGNHDSRFIQEQVALQRNAVVLDEGAVAEVEGLRFIGWGDPRFTPDVETRDEAPADILESTGQRLAAAIGALDQAPHVALVHDPAMAEPLDGLVPLALAGHGHERETHLLEEGTRVFEQGSTGAAGLRGLEGEEPTPLQCSVLYFDRDTGALQAWDDITLGGIGLASARIERHLPDEEEQSPVTPPPPSPAATAPTLAPTVAPRLP
jgi:predicted MPP superfamily phosphohydrolase